MRYRSRMRQMSAAVRKRIRRDIDDTHYFGLRKIELEVTAVQEH
jgi:hypothetical protein